MAAGPEHDVGKVQEVEEDEMWTDAYRRADPGFIAYEQMPDVSNLTDKQGNPVDADKDMIDCEWCWMSVALAKGGVAVVEVMLPAMHTIGNVIGVVDGGDYGEKPGG